MMLIIPTRTVMALIDGDDDGDVAQCANLHVMTFAMAVGWIDRIIHSGMSVDGGPYGGCNVAISHPLSRNPYPYAMAANVEHAGWNHQKVISYAPNLLPCPVLMGCVPNCDGLCDKWKWGL